MRLTTVLGDTYLLAMGAAALLLFAFSMCGIPWSRMVLLIGLAVITLIVLIAAKGAKIYIPPLTWWNLIDLFTIALIAGYTRLALAAPPIENDYLLIWGVKGKEFFLARGIDWSWLEAPINITAHTDYPLLVPLVFDAHALIAGTWPDRWLGIVNVCFGIATLLVVRGLIADDLVQPWRAIATAILMPLVFSPYIGIAEGPLIAYALAGLLHIRRGATLRGAVFLGLAAFTKNEGLALIVAVAIALVLARRFRELLQLLPAIAIPLPWLALRSMHELTNDLMVQGIFARLVEHVLHPQPILSAMARHPVGNLFFWGGIVVACALGWRRLLSAERFLTIAVIAQLLFLLGAYFISPREIEWHVQWSFERVIRQVMPAMALLAMFVTPWSAGFPEKIASRR